MVLLPNFDVAWPRTKPVLAKSCLIRLILCGRLRARTALALLFIAGLSSCTDQTTYWSESERAVLRSLSLDRLLAVPPAPSNRVADDPRAIELGKKLFFEPRLSASGRRSCASCHQPERQFTDGRALGQGVNSLTRNTPSVIGGGWQSWFYWDGRRDSLWSQALIPIEAPDEMGGSRSGAVRLVLTDSDYRARYTDLFGPLPPALNHQLLPKHAGEFTDTSGKNAWYRLPRSTQAAINIAYANIGKSIAAFERTLTPKPSAFDRYVNTLESDTEERAEALLSPAARRGAKLFIDAEKSRCLQCHNGPLMTNGGFHNIGTGTLAQPLNPQEDGAALDFGRLLGVQAVLRDPFNCLGPYSDAKPEQCSSLRFLSKDQHADIAGAYKTPSLRNAAQTGPYFHDGRYKTLREVMEHYASPPQDTAHELSPLDLDESQLDDLVAFIESLSSATYEP